MSTKSEVRKILESCVAGFNKATAELEAATVKLTGNYSGVMVAAMVAGTADTFAEVCDGLFEDIRANKGGIAKRLKCAAGDAKDGEKPSFKIPSGMSTAKSVILASFKYGVDLGTREAPESFNAVRKAVRSAQEAERLANGSERDRMLAEARAILATIGENLRNGTESQLPTILTALRSVASALKTETGKEAPKASKKESAGEKLSKAA